MTHGVPEGADLRDEFIDRPITFSEKVFQGRIWNVRRDTVDLGDAGVVQREYVEHTGAVGVLALDDQDRVKLVRQYRHPVRMELWELPAGLLDVPGEPPLEAARRELAEEADLVAGQWFTLIDWFNSPGGMTEALRLFLARDLGEVAEADRHDRQGEELGMPTRWVDLDELHAAVLAGKMHNPGTVVGVLAAHAARAAGWSTLRPADAPWPEHPAWRAAEPAD